MINPKLVPQLKQQLKFTFEFLNQENTEEEAQLKRQANEVQKKLDKVNERYALGEIERSMHEQFKSKFESELDTFNSQLEKVSLNLSNLDRYLDTTITISQNINKIWSAADYETRQKVQYLAFPEGISYDKKNNRYLTPRINSYFAALPVLSVTNGPGTNDNGSKFAPMSSLVASTGIEPISKV